MENSINNCVTQRVFSNHKIRKMHQEDQEEESSWLIYFEDIDYQEDEMIKTKEEMSHYYDNDSSMISDAASPPDYITKINNVGRGKANNINKNPKKRRIIHQHKEEEEKQKGDQEEEEEDTASSPSNKTKVFSLLVGAKENKRIVKSMDNITSEAKRCKTDTGSKMNDIMNEEFYAELKKKGLCVVPLSMLSNFIA